VHTITYLAQLLVALHHTGKSEQARDVATRLFALTKPEGYVRVYLDEGEPMRQALQALLAPHPERRRPDASTTAYVSTLLTAFAQQEQDAHGPLKTAPSPAPVASSGFGAPGVTLTRREQDVLRLLAEGASNQDIARTLVIELSTVKKHVSNVLGKLGATNRTRAVSRARALSLL
jgi:LuxR family maltose regulon positive regulatory protein